MLSAEPDTARQSRRAPDALRLFLFRGHTEARTTGGGVQGQSERGRAYLRLLKLNVPELGLYPLLGIGAAWRDIGGARGWAACACALAFGLCCSTLSIVLDDIEGFRDGVDQLALLAAKRNIAKPLLTGELSLADARRAALVIVLVASMLAAALAWLGAAPALATTALLAVTLLGVTQYSWGTKLSYRGLGEAVIVFGAAMTTALPVWVVRGGVDLPTIWIAATSGVPYAAQIVVSNAVDHDADARAGRRTLTVLVGRERAAALAGGRP